MICPLLSKVQKSNLPDDEGLCLSINKTFAKETTRFKNRDLRENNLLEDFPLAPPMRINHLLAYFQSQ